MKLTKFNELLEDGEVIKGDWELGPNHELRYRAEGLDEEFKFIGSLIATEPEALVFSVTEKQSDQKVVTSIQKLNGAWKLNSKNQITFAVEKESGENDTLTFQSGWKVNDTHEIVYTYEQINLKTKQKEIQELVFKGYWDISEKNRLTYYLGVDSDSSFRFRGAFQTKSILAKKGEIRYQAGVEVAGKRKTQAITLFGRWIVSRDLNLDFEIVYEDGKKSISFGGQYSLDDKRQITVNLKRKDGEPLGLELILTQDMFNGNGQAFVRLQKSLEESSIEAGVRFVW